MAPYRSTRVRIKPEPIADWLAGQRELAAAAGEGDPVLTGLTREEADQMIGGGSFVSEA